MDIDLSRSLKWYEVPLFILVFALFGVFRDELIAVARKSPVTGFLMLMVLVAGLVWYRKKRNARREA